MTYYGDCSSFESLTLCQSDSLCSTLFPAFGQTFLRVSNTQSSPIAICCCVYILGLWLRCYHFSLYVKPNIVGAARREICASNRKLFITSVTVRSAVSWVIVAEPHKRPRPVRRPLNNYSSELKTNREHQKRSSNVHRRGVSVECKWRNRRDSGSSPWCYHTRNSVQRQLFVVLSKYPETLRRAALHWCNAERELLSRTVSI